MLNKLIDDIKKFKYSRVSGVTVSSLTYIIADLALKLDKSILFIVDDTIDLSSMVEEIKFWTNNSDLLADFVPSRDENARLGFLFELLNEKQKRIVCINDSDILDSTLSKNTLLKKQIYLKIDNSYNRNSIINQLLDLGYKREDEINSLGEFSVRGEILDIWSGNYKKPIRIVFYNDVIERMSIFDIEDQRSKKNLENINILPFKESEEITILDYFKADDFLVICNASFEALNRDILKVYSKIVIEPLVLKGVIDFNVHSMVNFGASFEFFLKQLKNWVNRGFKVNLISYNDGENKRLKELLKGKITFKYIAFLVGYIRNGFIDNVNKSVFITDKEIFNRYDDYDVKPKDSININAFKESSLDYKIGDYIIHTNYGLGKFLGLKRLKLKEIEEDYLAIEYNSGDKLYVPIYNFDLIHRYISAGDYAPTLSVLGKNTWTRLKRKVYEKIREMAKTIISVEAKRKTVKGFKFKTESIYENEFADSFIYEETEDQKRAIIEVLDDMGRVSPMERLVCGDVGYGKTEVAIRAAFKALMNNKQVVMLVPTTILAVQHFNTFKERFANYPFRCELLSRFITKKSRDKIIEDLALSKVDILISTHGILSDKIMIPNLGLLIIDEEHRFGVKSKEKLKKLYKTIDVLHMTATPIPRSLSMALNGLKKISLIETPPINRKSIKTIISIYDKTMIKDAINFELARSGQIFYVYNDISTIENKRKELLNLVENKNISIVHGRMTAKNIEKTMMDFVNKKIDILLTTTIIESGIDIPSVNMMIVENTDKFGLAQLYQLRGRVGRGNTKAFCYFFYKQNKNLTQNAVKRLKALQEFEELGAGFKLALRDLEIRGCGNILGKEQHGSMKEVGFELYAKLLNKAVEKIRTGEDLEELSPEISIGVNAYFPDNYIKNPSLRIGFYKALLNINSYNDINNIKEELGDRFGSIPEIVKTLLEIAYIRLLAKKNYISKIYIDFNSINLTVYHKRIIDVHRLLKVASKYKYEIKFDYNKEYGDTIVLHSFESSETKINILKKFLQILEQI